MNELFELSHSRVRRQTDKMTKCIELGICPFCWNNLAEWHDNPVEYQGKFWAVAANDYPYPGTVEHYLAIYRDHVDSISSLAEGAGDELFKIFNQLCEEKGIHGTTIVFRTGKMEYNGATVFHLHAQLIYGVSRTTIKDTEDMNSWLLVKAGYKKTG